jgi:hypothetical protein
MKIVSLGSVFENVYDLIRKSNRGHSPGQNNINKYLNEETKKFKIKTLIKQCDFVEKCLEDLLETHMKSFLM